MRTASGYPGRGSWAGFAARQRLTLAFMRVPCVGGVVRDDAGRLLVIKRGQPPAQGRWSIPGGRVEAGESAVAAVAREVAEETGLEVCVGALVGSVERSGPGGVTYAIDDYLCAPTGGGTLRAGSDATDARWVSAAELHALDCAPGLVEALRAWDLLPAG
jgi:ADP-ribose pyrophosphatase YjhB (NUDIX family)